ncbi:hypothetical protein GCM10009540_36900 [Streptomyces turgidiscabies]
MVEHVTEVRGEWRDGPAWTARPGELSPFAQNPSLNPRRTIPSLSIWSDDLVHRER